MFRLPVSHPVGHKVGEDDHVHPNGGIIQQPREPIQLLLAVAVIIARQGFSGAAVEQYHAHPLLRYIIISVDRPIDEMHVPVSIAMGGTLEHV